MGVGSGDRLARGTAGAKASWGPLDVSEEKWEQAVSRRKSEKKEWCRCNDCPGVFYNGEEFAAHLTSCESPKKRA